MIQDVGRNDNDCNRAILRGHHTVLFMKSSDGLNKISGMVTTVLTRVVALSDQSGLRSSDRNPDRYDCNRTILRDHRTVLLMKPSGGLDKTSGMVTTILTRVVALSDQSGLRFSDRNPDRYDCNRAILRDHRSVLLMKPSGGLDETLKMVTTVLTRVVALSGQSGSRSSDRNQDRYDCNRTIFRGHRNALYMRSSDRSYKTTRMVQIIFAWVVTIFFESVDVWIVIKDQGRYGCSRATFRGYRTDLRMKPSGGFSKLLRIVTTFLTRVTTCQISPDRDLRIEDRDRYDGSHMVPREHRTISCMKPSGGLDEKSRMVTTVLSRVATWISLDLDRLETVATHTPRGNRTLARVDRQKVSGSYKGMWSPTDTSVLAGRSVKRIPSVIIVTVMVTALVIS